METKYVPNARVLFNIEVFSSFDMSFLMPGFKMLLKNDVFVIDLLNYIYIYCRVIIAPQILLKAKYTAIKAIYHTRI